MDAKRKGEIALIILKYLARRVKEDHGDIVVNLDNMVRNLDNIVKKIGISQDELMEFVMEVFVEESPEETSAI